MEMSTSENPRKDSTVLTWTETCDVRGKSREISSHLRAKNSQWTQTKEEREKEQTEKWNNLKSL